MNKKVFKNISLVILILFTTWRFGFSLLYNWQYYINYPEEYIFSDAIEYVALAQSLLERGEYNMGENQKPYSLRTPGFPIFLMLAMKLTGKYWLLTVLIIHVLAGVLSALIAYLIAADLRNHITGLFAAFFTASYAPYCFMCYCVYREMISLALFSVFLVLLYPKWYRSYTFMLMGIFLGLAAMVREELILMAIPCLLLVVHREVRSRSHSWKLAISKVLILSGLILLIFSPWVIRNWHTFKKCNSVILPAKHI